MCEGIRQVTGSDIAISVTGIAGPRSDSSMKPAGLTYICISNDEGSKVKKYQLRGSRDSVRRRAAQTALNMIRLRQK